MYFVPFTFMFIFTMFTVKKLIVRQTSDNQQLTNNAQRNRRISIMPLSMCLAYVLLTLPNRLYFSVFPNQIIGHDYTDSVSVFKYIDVYKKCDQCIFSLYIGTWISTRCTSIDAEMLWKINRSSCSS
jgi:hypothetical protein